MRNITDDQAEAVAFDIVRELLDTGVETLTISETLEEVDPDLEIDSEDVAAVRGRVNWVLSWLSSIIEDEQKK